MTIITTRILTLNASNFEAARRGAAWTSREVLAGCAVQIGRRDGSVEGWRDPNFELLRCEFLKQGQTLATTSIRCIDFGANVPGDGTHNVDRGLFIPVPSPGETYQLRVTAYTLSIAIFDSYFYVVSGFRIVVDGTTLLGREYASEGGERFFDETFPFQMPPK